MLQPSFPIGMYTCTGPCICTGMYKYLYRHFIHNLYVLAAQLAGCHIEKLKLYDSQILEPVDQKFQELVNFAINNNMHILNFAWDYNTHT